MKDLKGLDSFAKELDLRSVELKKEGQEKFVPHEKTQGGRQHRVLREALGGIRRMKLAKGDSAGLGSVLKT